MIGLPSYIQSVEGVPPRIRQPKKKFIIDTDGGSDDAHAIITAVHCARLIGADIIGITCVSGNTLLPLVIKNIKIALCMAGAPDIPIYAGCDRSISQSQWTDNFFLEDGLCGHQKRYMEALKIDETSLSQKQHAVQFIIDSVLKFKEDLDIIVIGPMTNIACALIKSHEIEHLMGNVVFLGGTICGLGIVENAVSEFNAYTDVEAIHLVFKVLQSRVIMIPYESCVVVSGTDVARTFEYETTQMGLFVKRIYESMWCFNQRYDIQDPLAIIVAMMPHAITRYIERKCHVVLHGEARGLIAIDWIGRLKTDYVLTGEVSIVIAFDQQLLMSILHDAIKEDGQHIKQLF